MVCDVENGVGPGLLRELLQVASGILAAAKGIAFSPKVGVDHQHLVAREVAPALYHEHFLGKIQNARGAENGELAGAVALFVGRRLKDGLGTRDILARAVVVAKEIFLAVLAENKAEVFAGNVTLDHTVHFVLGTRKRG